MVNELREALDLLKADPPPWRHDIEDFVAAGRRLERRRQRRLLAGSCLAVGVVTGTALIFPPTLWNRESREPSPVVALNAPGAAPPGESVTTSPGASPSGSVTGPGPSPAAGSPSPSITPSPGSSDGAPEGATSGPGAVPAPSRPFGFTLRGYRVGTFTVGDPTASSATYQRAPVYQDGKVQKVVDGAGRVDLLPASQADLVVYRPGAFTPPSLKDAEAATVAGRQARWQTFSTHVLLAWEYADGAWATLQTAQAADQDLITSLPRIAAGLIGGAEAAARVPYRMSYLPAGFAPAEVAVRAHSGEQLSTTPSDGTASSVIFTNRGPAGSGLPDAPVHDWRETPGGGVLVVEVVEVVAEAGSNNPLPPGGAPPAGLECVEPGTLCYRWSKDGKYQVTVESTRDVSLTERLKVLEGIGLTGVDTPSTWVDVAVAFPASRR